MKHPTRCLFIPDVHIPYHDKRAWALMLKAMRSFRPQIIVTMGDFGDYYAVSKFSKDPERADKLESEFKAQGHCLDDLDSLGAKEKIFIAGNHSKRFDLYIADNAPELHGIMSIRKALNLDKRGWRWVGYRDDFKLGKVYLTHDVGATGRNMGHKAIDIYQHSIITGHGHRMIYIVEADGLGTPILSAQFGWLGDLSYIDYQHRIVATKAYVLGFGVGYLERSSGILFANPVPIVNYRCMVEGRIFQG